MGDINYKSIIYVDETSFIEVKKTITNKAHISFKTKDAKTNATLIISTQLESTQLDELIAALIKIKTTI